jgi:hypothetical protein
MSWDVRVISGPFAALARSQCQYGTYRAQQMSSKLYNLIPNRYEAPRSQQFRCPEKGGVMSEPTISRHVEPLPPSAISYFRTRLRCGLSDAVKSPSIAAPQGLLLLSLTYGAGASVEELARMRLEFLLSGDGTPSREVRFNPSVTKHRTTRGVAMHPDIAADLVAFRHAFPAEQWVAFRSPGYGSPGREHLPASALTRWFRGCLREAGLGQFSVASGRKAFHLNQRRSS